MSEQHSASRDAGKAGPPILFDRALRRRRAARHADAESFLHGEAVRLAAESLMDVTRNFERAAVWGDPAGRLAEALPPGKIGAITYPAADDDAEASPFDGAGFDLVISLLDLHAANDPAGALIQARRALAPDGLFLGLMFGADTLKELRTALSDAEIETTGGLSPRIFPFADVRDAGGLLQRAGFALPVADATALTVRYRDPLRLLADLRLAGESNVLTARLKRFTRRATLMRALEIYRERFADPDGRVRATFSMLTLTGWRPHESQQQPLKPGSGKVSLAEALKPPRRD